MQYSIPGLVLSILLVAGCASHSVSHNYDNPELDKLMSGELVFNRQVTESELPEVDLFAISDDMKLFAREVVKRGHSHDEKAELLHKALLMPIERGGHGIRYVVNHTSSPKETFNSKTTNCLGYTLLFVSMSRFLGLDAQVNFVAIPPTWYMNDSENYFLMRHVNAKLKVRRFLTNTTPSGRIQIADISDVVVDLEMRRFRSNYPQRILSDKEVEALFYNNKAMEFLELANYQQSFLFLRRALKSSNEAYIWSNVGSLYRRMDKLQYAELAYLKALSLNSKDLSVLHNLYALYEKMGRKDDAEIYRQKVQAYREENPYYLYQLAMKAKSHQDVQSAKKWIESAIKREKKDDRLFLLAAEVYELDGNIRRARQMRTKAEELQAIK